MVAGCWWLYVNWDGVKQSVSKDEIKKHGKRGCRVRWWQRRREEGTKIGMLVVWRDSGKVKVWEF